VWSGGKRGEPELLAACYRNCLALAAKNNVKSIAFPNISTGIYGFPKREAAAIAVKTVRENQAPDLERVLFTCFDSENFALYQELLHDAG
jgi:O-acetyl-ADP-ribose deacetylase (regulator of RNase III)